MPALPPFDELPLYARLRRADILAHAVPQSVRDWYGYLLPNGPALMLASLASDGWQVRGPDIIRREIRRPRRGRRRPATRLVVPTPALLLCQAQARAKYVYVGQVRNHGLANGTHANGNWTDFQIDPALPPDLWVDLRFHTLSIDGVPVEVDEHTLHHDSVDVDINALLEPILFHRRRVTVVVDDRVRGRLTYSKRGARRRFVHERAGLVRQATAWFEQSAYDALWLYWSFGELFSHLEWTPPEAGAGELSPSR